MKDTINAIGRYPQNTVCVVSLEALIRRENKIALSERMSTRMVKSAAVLEAGEYIGWQLSIPRKGMVRMSVFGSQSLCTGDLKWLVEKTGKAAANPHVAAAEENGLQELYELRLPVAGRQEKEPSIGFGSTIKNNGPDTMKWPVSYSAQFGEMVKAFQAEGGIFRAVVGPANDAERAACASEVLHTFSGGAIDARDYIGCPVKAKFLVRLPNVPTIRLKTVLAEAVPGIDLCYLGNMADQSAANVWNDPVKSAYTLPDYAARILLLEPELHQTVIGINTYEEATRKIPASHKNATKKGVVTIGKATDTSGVKRKMTIGELDLRRHYQIIGQTGTGKSTLLISIVLSAVEQGYGLTFFDPHGSTIDIILRSLPEKYVDRIRVVRIGDAENPVPLNIWDSDDPRKEERNISDLCELFTDIFDPKRQGFVGPRYERWLSTFAKASIAFLGKRASLESIAVISQSQDNMLKVCKAIILDYPELVETIKQEYGTDRSSDFQNVLNWYLCKFQRLTSVEQLRKTLGAGANALDFAHSIDTDKVTLIDLAAPSIGTNAARIVGTLLMMKLWNAAMMRKERGRTHLVIADEAQLFQTNPMPRMLAESRKFGLSMVLCHQHTGQLTEEIRDALEANSANFSAFRLSPRDAAIAAIRFDDPSLQIDLTRLDAFNAVTTLSIDGRQTSPFTLETIPPKKNKDGEEIATLIESMSIETLVNPYRNLGALTSAQILDLLNHSERQVEIGREQVDAEENAVPKPEWLKKWTRRRRELKPIA